MKAAKARSDVRYTATSGLNKKDVPLVVGELETIERERGRLDTGELASEMVERARSKSSPTHHLFEWNDRKAAEAQRLDRARQIIRSVQVIFEAQPENPVRAFPVLVTRGKKGPYAMTRAIDEPDLMKAILEQAKADARTWARRWERLRDLAELRGVFDAIDKVTK